MVIEIHFVARRFAPRRMANIALSTWPSGHARCRFSAVKRSSAAKYGASDFVPDSGLRRMGFLRDQTHQKPGMARKGPRRIIARGVLESLCSLDDHLIYGLMDWMANTWIVDLRHFLTSAGTLAPLPSSARILAQYWTHIVAQGSTFDQPLTLRCRRRPRRRPCAGILEIALDEDLEGMLWGCPVCGDNGIIRGWQGTFWDLSDGSGDRSIG
jgi:hypothetical protein